MFLLLWVLFFTAAGCIELQDALLSGGGRSSDGGLWPSGPDDSGNGNGPSGVPVVALGVSNPNPLVGEEVLLTCSLVAGDPTGVTFAFHPVHPRLLVNPQAGTAELIIEQPDVGSELAFTCTASNETGTSEPSNEELIIPGA